MAPEVFTRRTASLRTLLRYHLILAFVVSGSALAQGPATDGDPVDFSRDVVPILETHCYECHGPDKQESGLRLDSVTGMIRAGDSQIPVIGGTLETNELYQRVSSDDPQYRMPAYTDPLDAEAIEVLRRWVEQGSPVPNAGAVPELPSGEAITVESVPPPTAAADFERLTVLVQESTYLKVLLVLFLLANVGILAVERKKKRLASGDEDASTSWIRRIGPMHYLNVWSVFVLLLGAFGFVANREEIRELRHRLAMAEVEVRVYEREAPGLFELASSVTEIYGDPPYPVRMMHPKAMERTYYRGNDERHPSLFNGGRYRTSTMHVRLVDAEGNALDYGDRLPDEGVQVEWEFDRAPNTSRELFKRVEDAVFMNDAYPFRPGDDNVSAEVMEPGQRWRMRYPIDLGDGSDPTINGIVYVYFGGRVHYGVCYDLLIEDGRIAEESDVWMGNLFVSAFLLPPTTKVSSYEWLDYLPIPTIEGEHVTDPDLLGLPEHEKAYTP